MRMLEDLAFFKTDFYPKLDLINVSDLVSLKFSFCFPVAVAMGKPSDEIPSFFQSNDGKSSSSVFSPYFYFLFDDFDINLRLQKKSSLRQATQ